MRMTRKAKLSGDGGADAQHRRDQVQVPRFTDQADDAVAENGAQPVTRLADGAHLPFILQDSSTNVRKGLDRICKREKVRLENYSQVTSSVLVIRAVENQQGLGIVPSSFLPFASALHAFRCYEFTDQRSESGILYTPGEVFSSRASREKYCISLIHSLLHREYEECQQLARETWER